MAVHCTDIPHFIYPFTNWVEYLCCFQFLAIMSKTYTNICVEIYPFILSTCLGLEMLSHMVDQWLTFLGNVNLVLIVILICIFLMAKDVEYYFQGSLAIHILSLVKFTLKSSANYSTILFDNNFNY